MINIDTKKVSYRTNKENIDLSEIAKKMGGGGHKKAAGSPIENKVLDELLINIFKSEVGYA
jgi:nanoRNase/pAp phosphatase (c-di-AMP/oligoRNAs hydrolase)